MSDAGPFVFMAGAVIVVILIFALTTGDDGRKTVYCDRGGHVVYIPDGADQTYDVRCVRTTRHP